MDSKEEKVLEAANEQVLKLGWVDDGTAEPQDENQFTSMNYVTHWQPLPSPPIQQPDEIEDLNF